VKFEIRVPNYSYIAVGIAKTEEIARKNALKNILLYLANKNEIPAIPKVKKNDNSFHEILIEFIYLLIKLYLFI